VGVRLTALGGLSLAAGRAMFNLQYLKMAERWRESSFPIWALSLEGLTLTATTRALLLDSCPALPLSTSTAQVLRLRTYSAASTPTGAVRI
jgi:hypothetical protein